MAEIRLISRSKVKRRSDKAGLFQEKILNTFHKTQFFFTSTNSCFIPLSSFQSYLHNVFKYTLYSHDQSPPSHLNQTPQSTNSTFSNLYSHHPNPLWSLSVTFFNGLNNRDFQWKNKSTQIKCISVVQEKNRKELQSYARSVKTICKSTKLCLQAKNVLMPLPPRTPPRGVCGSELWGRLWRQTG